MWSFIGSSIRREIEMKRLLFALMLLAALPLAAQEPKNPIYTPRVFILKYADPNQLSNLFRVFVGSITQNHEMHAIAVSGSPEAIATIEDAIKRLDVPPPPPQNIELTVYYVIGGDSENAGGVLPKDLDSVATQLKNAFPFKTYRLLDALELRTRNGQGGDGSGSPGPNAGGLGATVTQFHMNSASVSQDGSSVRIDSMKAGVKLPVAKATTEGGYTYVDLGVNADVDIKPGQKVVVGHLSMGQNQALFLVLMVRVVN
jgi:hypothetical protein